MQRRTFGLLAGSSSLALAAGVKTAEAQTAAPLGPGLTPFGSEAAGNKEGTIPPWTGGLTSVPEGMSWDPTKTLPPDFFASDKMLYKVDQSNLSQYAHLVPDSVREMITKDGFSLQVYPTHRTAAYPDHVLKSIALNVNRSKLDPAGGRLGFTGGLGGIPFPILDTTDPYKAGAQLIWNHSTRWTGVYLNNDLAAFVVQGRGAPILAALGPNHFYYSYYDPNMTPEKFDGILYKLLNTSSAPPTVVGNEICYWDTTNPSQDPIKVWQVLAGQGRVRRAPEVEYDAPSSFVNGVANYDEYYGFSGAPNQYDWKLVGKQEILIPYNNNKIYSVMAEDFLLPKFPNPEHLRWELHRCWILEATLHPGNRNVMAKRRMYVDEDTWQIGVTDTWDAKGNLYHANLNPKANFPNMPGTVYQDTYIINLQTGSYCAMQGNYANPGYNKPWTYEPHPASTWEPQAMAASAAY